LADTQVYLGPLNLCLEMTYIVSSGVLNSTHSLVPLMTSYRPLRVGKGGAAAVPRLRARD